MTDRIDRRYFMKNLLLGAAASVPWRATWATATLAPADLKLVFYSDVHARTEWGTPEALAMAADAINAQAPDIVIACGDLITDGFQSSAETVAPRWHTYMQMHRALKAETHAAIGNHDLVAAIPEDGTEPSDDPKQTFRETFGVSSTYYSFRCAGLPFHAARFDLRAWKPRQIPGAD